MADIGYDVLVEDDPLAGADPSSTDTLYLLSAQAGAPATPTPVRRADTGDAAIDAQIRAYLIDDGKSLVLQGYQAVPSTRPSLENALLGLPKLAGQVCAPEAVTAADLIKVANGAWARNKVALLNGPGSVSDAAIKTLADAVIAGADGRGAALFADTARQPGATPAASPVSVPFAISVAAMIARNDRLDASNPGVAAAGRHGISNALGVVDARSDARRGDVGDHQVNVAQVVKGSLRNYGIRTLADLDELPQWWDLSGSRVIMKLRALAGDINEEEMFGQIDGRRILLDRYEGLLRSICAELYRVNALFGKTADDAYRVSADDELNPISELKVGRVAARVQVKTSPFAEHFSTFILRRDLDATF